MSSVISGSKSECASNRHGFLLTLAYWWTGQWQAICLLIESYPFPFTVEKIWVYLLQAFQVFGLSCLTSSQPPALSNAAIESPGLSKPILQTLFSFPVDLTIFFSYFSPSYSFVHLSEFRYFRATRFCPSLNLGFHFSSCSQLPFSLQSSC